MPKGYVLSPGAAAKVRELIRRTDLTPRPVPVPPSSGGDADIDTGIAVIGTVDAGTAGPRLATVYDPDTMEERYENVCPAEIAGQFATGAHTAAHVVAIRCAVATAGEDEET